MSRPFTESEEAELRALDKTDGDVIAWAKLHQRSMSVVLGKMGALRGRPLTYVERRRRMIARGHPMLCRNDAGPQS